MKYVLMMHVLRGEEQHTRSGLDLGALPRPASYGIATPGDGRASRPARFTACR
jgi:hypothetical protein